MSTFAADVIFRIPKVAKPVKPRTLRVTLGKGTIPYSVSVCPSIDGARYLMLSSYWDSTNGELLEVSLGRVIPVQYLPDDLPANVRAKYAGKGKGDRGLFNPPTITVGDFKRPVDLSLSQACADTWGDDGPARAAKILQRRAVWLESQGPKRSRKGGAK